MKELLAEIVKSYKPWLVELRRNLHMHPELAFQETRTAGLMAENLESLGLPYHAGVGKTGVIGLLRDDTEGPTVAIRGDMDALPIQEENDVPYASTRPGLMHACGHDAHTTCLLYTSDAADE